MSLSNGYDLPSLTEWQQSIRTIEQLAQDRDELLDLVKRFHRKLETYRNIYTGDTELHRLLSECEAAIAKVAK